MPGGDWGAYSWFLRIAGFGAIVGAIYAGRGRHDDVLTRAARARNYDEFAANERSRRGGLSGWRFGSRKEMKQRAASMTDEQLESTSLRLLERETRSGSIDRNNEVITWLQIMSDEMDRRHSMGVSR